MSLIKFLLFRNKKTSALAYRKYGEENKFEPQETSALASRKYGKDIDISISIQEDYDKVIVADYYTINEYIEKMKKIHGLDIDKSLNTSVVWNSKRQKVNKGTYFVFGINGHLYNILINDEIIKIDERHIVNKQTMNSVVTFYNNSPSWEYFTCMHDENGSTYDTKYCNSKGFATVKAFEMSRHEAVCNWVFITRELKNFKAIDEIVDMGKLDEHIFVKLDGYLFDNNNNKMIK